MDLGTVGFAVVGGAAFVGVFSVFLAAFVFLAVVTLRWAVRRDRVGRSEWIKRRSAQEHGAPPAPAQTNGHAGHAARGAQGRGSGQDRPAGQRGEPEEDRPTGRKSGPGQRRNGVPRQHRGPGGNG